MDRRAISRVAVVIPARNEEKSIGSALRGVRAAARMLPSHAVEVIVVANGCTDDTALTASELDAHVINLEEPNVGAARGAGATWALRHGAGGLWIANTDADSVVPPHWLSAQVEAAAAGADALLGTVALAPEDGLRYKKWIEKYRAKSETGLGHGHGHVHGANLGIRATAYEDVGGFWGLPAHEDADLVDRLSAAGALLERTTAIPVRTSARRTPRAAGGVGTDLAASD